MDKELLKKVYQALNDKKAEEITLLEIGQISPIADYFVIASGSNVNQLNAMKDAVDEVMYTNGLHARQIEGNSKSTWILMDYGDIPRKTAYSIIWSVSGKTVRKSIRKNSDLEC